MTAHIGRMLTTRMKSKTHVHLWNMFSTSFCSNWNTVHFPFNYTRPPFEFISIELVIIISFNFNIFCILMTIFFRINSTVYCPFAHIIRLFAIKSGEKWCFISSAIQSYECYCATRFIMWFGEKFSLYDEGSICQLFFGDYFSRYHIRTTMTIITIIGCCDYQPLAILNCSKRASFFSFIYTFISFITMRTTIIG